MVPYSVTQWGGIITLGSLTFVTVIHIFPDILLTMLAFLDRKAFLAFVPGHSFKDARVLRLKDRWLLLGTRVIQHEFPCQKEDLLLGFLSV